MPQLNAPAPARFKRRPRQLNRNERVAAAITHPRGNAAARQVRKQPARLHASKMVDLLAKGRIPLEARGDACLLVLCRRVAWLDPIVRQ